MLSSEHWQNVDHQNTRLCLNTFRADAVGALKPCRHRALDLCLHHRVSAGERTGCISHFDSGGKKQKQPLACLHAIKPITIILGEDEPRMQRWRPCKALWSGLHVERRGDVQVGEWKHTHTLKTVSSEAISLMNNSEQINWIKTQLVEPCCTKCVWARSMGLTIYSARLLKQTEEGGRGERRRRWAAVRIWSLNSPKSLKYFSKYFTNLNRKHIVYLLRNCTAITNDFETNQPNCLHLQTASYGRVDVFI